MIVSIPAPKELLCYVEARNKIEDWYGDLTPEEKADAE